MWERPLTEQVSVLRHDLAGASQALGLLRDQQSRMGQRLDNIETRQNVFDEQMGKLVEQMTSIAMTPLKLRDMVVDALKELEKERQEQEKLRQEELWKKISRLVVLVGGIVAIVPNIERIVRWFI